jgi:hypothetical protein
MSKITAEFQAYCAAHGRSVQDQLEHDRREFPGGSMCGFMCWIQRALSAFKTKHPEHVVGGWVHNHAEKIKFLTTEYVQS